MNTTIFTSDSINHPLCCFNTKDFTISGNRQFGTAFSNQMNEKMFAETLNSFISDSSDNDQKNNYNLITLDSQQYITVLLTSIPSQGLYYFLFEPITLMQNFIKQFSFVQQMENEYLSILESLHDDFTITDAEGRLLTALPNFESFYGVPSSEVIGKTVYQLEDMKIFNPSIAAKVIKSKKPETFLQMTGSGKYLMCTAIPVKDAYGDLIKVVSFSRDVTQYELLKDEHANLQEAIKYYSSEINKLKNERLNNSELIGDSKEIRKIVEMINRVSKFDTNVLLTGESGVGKTLYANAIHTQSERAEKPFIELNCGAIPENLFESELFGYEKGAFTGANATGKIGWIERADGGTLFLDEIADMPLVMQVKLLKTLDNKKITRVGGTIEKQVDFRLIAATNKNLVSLVEQGLFREDLFYRLNVISISIPALRDHKEDIFLLIMHFLKKYKEKYSIEKTFSNRAIDYLTNYPWPGNIRELENVIERLFLTVDSYVISEANLPDHLCPKMNLNKFDTTNKTLPEILEAMEKSIILESYEKHNSTTKVAAELGISQPSVSLKLKKYLSKQ